LEDLILPRSKRTILLIDAGAEKRAGWRRALKRERHYDYQFVEAESGEKGLAAYLKIKPDCVLLADRLPDLDSLMMLSRMSEESAGAALPVLMIGETDNQSASEQMIRSGAQDYLIDGETEPEYLRRAVYGVVEKIAVSRGLHLTEHQQAEEALRQSEERYRTIVETAHEGVWLMGLNASTIYLNERMAKLLGYSAEEVIGRQVPEFCFPEDMASARERIASNLRGQAEAFDFRFRRRDGSELHVLASTSPVRDGRDHIVGVVGMFIDIAERKQAEREREELLARERQAREMAEAVNRSKDEFLALVSHELRAPLNAMLGWARILKTRKVDEAMMARAIDTIERSAESQQQLVDDLLDTARIITGKLRLEVMPVDLMPVIEAAVDVVRPAAEAKGIDIELALDTETGIITGDSGRLQQVIWNLLSNAVKFTPQNGHIEVRLSRVDPHVQISVSDTGRGINPEVLPYVFDRFHQADSSSTRRYGGLGLGLSLVRHLVELHGGTISAESAGEGRGSTFTINLPLRAVRAPSEDLDHRSLTGDGGTAFQAALSDLRVLVVDDETNARELVTAVLEQYGARVTAVASVAEALMVIRAGEPALSPDVIISDLGMPDEDGYTLIHRVRELDAERGRQIPAVALTAYGRATDRIRALSAGFQMHVAKPVEPVELAMVVASLTGRAGKGVNA
jgi:PAS domain S-box-containing protein